MKVVVQEKEMKVVTTATNEEQKEICGTSARNRNCGGAYAADGQHYNGLSMDGIPRAVKEMQYAVRGRIVIRATELEAMKNAQPENYPKFERIIYANIGNPQLTGQRPITYIRQLMAALLYPDLLESALTRTTGTGERKEEFTEPPPLSPVAATTPSSPGDDGEVLLSPAPHTPQQKEDVQIPSDIQCRAKRWLKAVGGSMGCYSASKGVPLFKEEMADWFGRRDGQRPDAETIFLTAGASSAVKFLLNMMLRDSSDGVLVPVPEYPLYSASIVQLGGSIVPYDLDEENGWALKTSALDDAMEYARKNKIRPRCLVAINPGNPTGAVLRENVMNDVISFCEKENLLLIADEVYQQNIYTEIARFISFRSLVLRRKSPIQVVSLHSASKGLFGECGLRGGCMQLENVSSDVMSVLYKLCSVSLCANTVGQATMVAVVNPPEKGDVSYEKYAEETNEILESLARKAKLATKYFNSVKGLKCQPIEGALYAYPSLELPDGAVEAAKQQGVEADMLFCMELLENCGVVCVPGSGFGQRPGTYHLRMTILPAEKDFEPLLKRFVKFYEEFVARYNAWSATSGITTKCSEGSESDDN